MLSKKWCLNSQPLDHHSNALPTELSHYLSLWIINAFIKLCSINSINKVQHLKWCMKQKKAHFRNLRQIPTWLSWQGIWLMIRRSWVKTPLGKLLTKCILCCVSSDISDYLTEMPSSSWKIRLCKVSTRVETIQTNYYRLSTRLTRVSFVNYSIFF